MFKNSLTEKALGPDCYKFKEKFTIAKELCANVLGFFPELLFRCSSDSPLRC